MAEKDDDLTRRRTPADSEDDWMHLWSAADKAHKAWTVVGPIWAVISNWKTLVTVLVALVWLEGERVIAFVQQIGAGFGP